MMDKKIEAVKELGLNVVDVKRKRSGRKQLKNGRMDEV